MNLNKQLTEATKKTTRLEAGLKEAQGKLEAVAEYSAFLKSPKAKHLKDAVGIALNIDVLLLPKTESA